MRVRHRQGQQEIGGGGKPGPDPARVSRSPGAIARLPSGRFDLGQAFQDVAASHLPRRAFLGRGSIGLAKKGPV